MRDRPRIAIVGAGMGGLTTAILLQRFGFDVTIFEQAPRLERLGAGIQLSPNVTRIFRDLGLLDLMVSLGVVPRVRYGREGYTGATSFAVPVHQYPSMYGAPHLMIHRGDLQDALLSPIHPGTIQLAKQLHDITESSTGLRLQFADGSLAETDILIAADGINSRVRELLLGYEKPLYAGEIAYRAIYPVGLLAGLEIVDLTKWWGADGLNILIYFITHARDVIYFVTGVPRADWGRDDFAPRSASNAEVLASFAGFYQDVIRVVETAPTIIAWPVLEREPLPVWSRGNIVLIGDASHPMRPHLGQGAAMAIEDGVMLARCVDHLGGRDARAIFVLYEAHRRDRASRVQLRTKGSDWMRYGMGDAKEGADWLYAHDVFREPLDVELAQVQP